MSVRSESGRHHIAADKLINVYAGGGHTTLAMGEMFFRSGGLANVNPMMETATASHLYHNLRGRKT